MGGLGFGLFSESGCPGYGGENLLFHFQIEMKLYN